MADRLTLRLLTPQRELLDEEVSEVTAEGSLGQFGVLPDHVAFLTSLEPGALRFRRAGGGEQTLAVKGGYAEVHDNVMTVLADDAMAIGDIDRAAAESDRERAEAALEEAPFGHPDHERLRFEVKWAEARLTLAGGSETALRVQH